MTASLRPRRLSAPLATAHFHVFGYSFGVATQSALALRFLRRLYGSYVIENAELAPETFSLEGRRADRARPWEVYFGDQRLAGALSLGAAVNRLEYEICLRIVAHHPDLIALHGATVLNDGGAALISGPSGAGKSTLSLALAARGYRVGGDDVALLDPRTGTIRPVPRCFHLDARSRRLLRNVGLAMPAEALRYGFLTPTDLGMTEAPATPVRLILFLGRGGGRRPQLAPLSQAEMIVRLLSETPRGAHSTTEIMAVLRPLVSAAACYHLLGGRLSKTAETVAALLETLTQ
jgi:hypothetical protein